MLNKKHPCLVGIGLTLLHWRMEGDRLCPWIFRPPYGSEEREDRVSRAKESQTAEAAVSSNVAARSETPPLRSKLIKRIICVQCSCICAVKKSQLCKSSFLQWQCAKPPTGLIWDHLGCFALRPFWQPIPLHLRTIFSMCCLKKFD